MSYRTATASDIGRSCQYRLAKDKPFQHGILLAVEGPYAVVKRKHGQSLTRPLLMDVEVPK